MRAPNGRTSTYSSDPGGDLTMRKRMEAMRSKTALLTGMLCMLVVFSFAQAASANGGSSPKLEKVTPNKGCPGDKITLTGKNFGSTGPAYTDFVNYKVTPFWWDQETTITSSTSATTTVPVFLAVTPNDEKSSVMLDANSGGEEGGSDSNSQSFTFIALPTCF